MKPYLAIAVLIGFVIWLKLIHDAAENFRNADEDKKTKPAIALTILIFPCMILMFGLIHIHCGQYIYEFLRG